MSEEQIPKFTVDMMMFMMCINPVAGTDFDATSAYYSVYNPDGSIERYNCDTNPLPTDTVLDLVTKDSALDLIFEYTNDFEVTENASCSYDMFARRVVDGKTLIYAWYDRSK